MSETAGDPSGVGTDRPGDAGGPADADSLEYGELQELAKRAGVKANLARDELVERLRDHGVLDVQATGPDAEPAEPATNGSAMEVLEFTLADERYCLGIDHVAEIVDGGEITSVPGTAHHVEGVMDLRGTTTQIVNPKRVLEVPDDGDGERIVVVDLDGGGSVGWLVDEVHRVTDVAADAVDDTIDDGPVEGVLQRDDGFVVVLDPVAVSTDPGGDED
jgi:purine-binding chemotaxis protein CheW